MEQWKHFFYKEQGMLNWIGKIALALVIGIAALLLIHLIRTGLSRFQDRYLKDASSRRKRTVHTILFSLLRTIILFFAGIIILDLFGVNTSSLIATAGIGGIAIAFGSQKVVGDIISGFFILLDGNIQVGDYVNLDGKYEGTVKSISLRRTILIAYSGEEYIIPNSEIKTVSNFERNHIHSDVNLYVPYALAYEKLEKIVQSICEDVMKDLPELYVETPKLIGLVDFREFTYTARIISLSPTGKQWEASRELRRRILDAFMQEEAYQNGIDLPLRKKESVSRTEQ